MLKFFFGRRSAAGKLAVESQRRTVERALAEVNEIVASMAVKPKIIIDPLTGALDLELPEQMPDEALALPAPEDKSQE